MSGKEGILSKRAIRMEEIDDLVVKMLDVEEAKADIFAEMNKCPVLYANLSDAIERWLGSEEKKENKP